MSHFFYKHLTTDYTTTILTVDLKATPYLEAIRRIIL